MDNFSLADKQALEALVEAGAKVSTVAYYTDTVVGDPEADALAAGWTQYYKEHAKGSTLIEVIYTK